MFSYPSSGPVRSRLSYWTRYPYKPRLGMGLFFGWGSAAVLSLRVLVVAAVTHSAYLTRYHLPVAGILLGYWLAGTALGLVVGFAHPLCRSRWGSFALGFILGWLVYAITGLVSWGWDASWLLFALLPGLLVGGGLGVVFYDEEHSPAPRRPTANRASSSG